MDSTGNIFKVNGDYVFFPIGVHALVPEITTTNVQDITGPFINTEDAVGPVATIRDGADSKLIIGPVGMIRVRDIPLLRSKGIYPVFGPVGTVTFFGADPLVVRQSGQFQKLQVPQPPNPKALPSNQKFETGPAIASAVEGQVVLGPAGEPLYLNASVPGYQDGNCRALSPWTRLILENAGVSANSNYSNQAGVISSPGSSPTSIIQTTATSTYGLGIGYTNKPILKQMRALLYPSNARDATYRQGTFLEDFIYNAITVNASYSYGRTLALKSSTIHPTPFPTNTFNTRPYYSVGATWAMDLERLWVYATKPGARPVDPGFYYQPPEDTSSSFFIPPHQQPDWRAVPWQNDNRS